MLISKKNLNETAAKYTKYLEQIDDKHYAKTGRRLSTNKLNTIGICLDNFKSSIMSNPAKFFSEDIQSADVSFTKQFGAELVYKTLVSQLAGEIASEQPIQSRNAQINYIEYFYDKTNTQPEKELSSPFMNGLGRYGDDITGGGVSQAKLNAGLLASHIIAPKLLEQHTIITIGSKKYFELGGKIYESGVSSKKTYGTLDLATGQLDITEAIIDPTTNVASEERVMIQYATDNVTTPVQNVKKVSARIRSLPIRVKSVKILTVYSVEAVQELQSQFGIGIHTDFVDQVVQEVIATIDYDLMDHAKAAANTGNNVVDYKLSLAPGAVSAITLTQHYQDFRLKVSEASNKIFEKTRAVRANIMIIGPGVAPVVESLADFKSANSSLGGQSNYGAYVLGTLEGVKVIVNPNYELYDCILLFKSNQNPLQASLIYAPYLPISKVFSTDAGTFTNQIGLTTTYGVTVPNIHWFAKINITV